MFSRIHSLLLCPAYCYICAAVTYWHVLIRRFQEWLVIYKKVRFIFLESQDFVCHCKLDNSILRHNAFYLCEGYIIFGTGKCYT